jgi:hypothetical protein
MLVNLFHHSTHHTIVPSSGMEMFWRTTITQWRNTSATCIFEWKIKPPALSPSIPAAPHASKFNYHQRLAR